MTVLLRNEGDILAKSPDPERTYVEELLPLKAQAYANYVLNRSSLGDIKVIMTTVRAVVLRTSTVQLDAPFEKLGGRRP